MAKELPKHSICPYCDQLFTLIRIGPHKLPFYVHTGIQLDRCTAIGDDQKWKERCLIALEKMRKKRVDMGLPVNEDGMPRIFGEL